MTLDKDIQIKTENAKALIDDAQISFEKSAFDESEHYAIQVPALLEQYVNRIDSGNEYLEDSQKHSLIHLLARSYYLLNFISFEKKNYLHSISLAEKSVEYSMRINDAGTAVVMLGNIGRAYYYLNLYTKSLEHFAQAESLHELHGSKPLIADHFRSIAVTHQAVGSYSLALAYLEKSLELFSELDDKSNRANVINFIGSVYSDLGSYEKGLEYYRQALAEYEALDEKLYIATVTSNIGNVLRQLGFNEKSLEYSEKALAIYKELDKKFDIARMTGNLGTVYYSLGDYYKSMEYLLKAIAGYEETGASQVYIANFTGGVGTAYYGLGDYEKALEYYGKALDVYEKIGGKTGVTIYTGNIGSIYSDTNFEGYNPQKAEEYLLQAISLGEELGVKQYLNHLYKSLSTMYANENRWKEAHEYYKKHIEIRDEVQSEDARKKAALMEQQRLAAEREKEIELAKVTAAAKLTATTALLHKVLPESIATRMINGEGNIADYFPNVSILFADIAGFTPISANMDARMVVKLLNYVFGEFDRIIKKHGCEKIKTIGDGYMAIAGAPIECADHTERIISVALEMLATINLPEEFKLYMPEGSEFGIRIGLHTGSVVAGVIGDERFVWDVYSDAVNTAARMESHGEQDKIHVSEDFTNHVQEYRGKTSLSSLSNIRFIPRSEILIKGKGIMKTYFLEQSEPIA